MNLIELIDSATSEQLQEIRTEIATQAKRLEALKVLERVLATRLDPKPAAPTKQMVTAANEKEQRRKRIAKLIATEGPLMQAIIHAKTGIPVGSLTDIMNSPAFEKQPDGYHLTSEGRRLYLS